MKSVTLQPWIQNYGRASVGRIRAGAFRRRRGVDDGSGGDGREREVARKLQMITVVGERAVGDGGETLRCACGNGSAQIGTGNA